MRYHWIYICGLATLMTVFSCSEQKKEDIVYVNSVKLFEEFNMKAEYDKVLERDLKPEAMLVDSIQTIMENSSDSLTLYRLRKDYYIAEQLFNEKFNKLSESYTKSVTERLDEYIKKYANQQGYKIILSGNNGGVIYVNEAVDVTEELVKFVNTEFDKK